MFDQAIADKICDRIAQGEPLEAICRSDPKFPASRTVRRWIEDNPSLASDIARARVYGYDAIADECVRIADDRTIDPADKRVMVETRLKLLAKWDYKRYGDRIDHTHDVTSRIVLVDARSAASAALDATSKVIEHAVEVRQVAKDDQS